MAAFARQRGIAFPLLSDAGSATIRRYGILNPVAEEALGEKRDDPGVKADAQTFVSAVGVRLNMVGIALPGTFVVDPNGRVTSRFFEDFYVERNTVSSLLLKLGQGATPVSATRISTAQLDITTWPSDATVAPGNRFSLAVEIRPHRGIHVYAPGASDYRVVSVSVAPDPLVRTLPIEYPPPEIYHFKPLDERVPVYQKPFTLLQEVVLDGTLQAQAALRGKDTLTITGTLEYQACDDAICFNPASVPLSWTLSLRPLIFERPGQ
jgi:hypothetical protein